MKNLIGVASIALLWFKTAAFIRDLPFEFKLPAILLMGFISLLIAHSSHLIDKKPCRK